MSFFRHLRFPPIKYLQHRPEADVFLSITEKETIYGKRTDNTIKYKKN
jgi:hypothetical protein